MADRLIRAQVSIPLDSGIPEDSIINTFHFDDDDDPIAAWDDSIGWAHSLLTTFYQAIDTLMMPVQVGAAASVKYYDMRAATPRVPLDTRTIALTPSPNDSLPTEVAICLSFAGAVESGAIAARRRGRVYLGPVQVSSGDVSTGNRHVGSGMQTTIRDAAAVMKAGLEHPGSPGLHMKWAIYSPTTDALGTIDDAFHDVVSGWVDNAYDTQRRRGPAATTRLTF